MSGQMINIEMSCDRVCDLLRTMPDVSVNDIPGGIGMGFGEQQVAWVGDASPDEGTDISVKDWSGTVCWTIYDFLATNTTAYLWLLDDGGMVAASRWAPGQTEGRRPER